MSAQANQAKPKVSFFDRKVTYEIMVSRNGRWVIDSTHPAKSAAKPRAQELLGSNKFDAVRVTKEIEGSKEEIVFEQESAEKAEKPISISPIEEAAVCSTLDDLTTFPARKTTGRLLRAYLDEQNLTGLELLHDHLHLRGLARMESLYNQGIHRIASIQSRALGEDASPRLDLLFNLAAKVTDRTKKLKGIEPYLTRMNDDGLTATLGMIEESIKPVSRRFFTCAVLGRYVGQERDWNAKLGLVLDLLDKQPDDEALTHLDEICAEIVDGSVAIKGILGTRPDLASALSAMVQLAVGRYESTKKGNELLDRFNGAMAAHAMPATAGVLLDRAARAVVGIQPLTRKNAVADRAAFTSLMSDLISDGGLSGGADMSRAVTQRARIVMKTGDTDLTSTEGVNCIMAMLPSKAVSIGYLLDLCGSEFAVRHQEVVIKILMGVVDSLTSMSDLLPPGASPEEAARAVEDLRNRGGDNALGQEIGALISKKLDGVRSGNKHPENDITADVIASQSREVSKNKAEKAAQKNRVYQPGDIIFRQDDPGDEAFMIDSGEVRISTRSENGEVVLAELGRGEIFGEMALIDNQPRMATATAVTETSLSGFPQESFKKRFDALAEEDRIMHHLMKVFVQRLRQRASDL